MIRLLSVVLTALLLQPGTAQARQYQQINLPGLGYGVLNRSHEQSRPTGERARSIVVICQKIDKSRFFELWGPEQLRR